MLWHFILKFKTFKRASFKKYKNFKKNLLYKEGYIVSILVFLSSYIRKLCACQDPRALGAPKTLLEPPNSPDKNLPRTC